MPGANRSSKQLTHEDVAASVAPDSQARVEAARMHAACNGPQGQFEANGGAAASWWLLRSVTLFSDRRLAIASGSAARRHGDRTLYFRLVGLTGCYPRRLNGHSVSTTILS